MHITPSDPLSSACAFSTAADSDAYGKSLYMLMAAKMSMTDWNAFKEVSVSCQCEV